MRRAIHAVLLSAIVLSLLIAPSSRTLPVAAAIGGAPEPNMMVPSSVVARVYYTDQTDLARLAERLDIWEVRGAARGDDNYVIAALTQSDWQRLAAEGYRLQIEIGLTVELNRPRTYLPGQIDGIPGYPCYRTVEEAYATAESIVAQHPTLAQWIDIGDSWEKVTPGGNAGYDLRVLRLTNASSAVSKAKLFAMSSVHAREYAPAELNTRFAEYLVNNYGVDADVTWLLDYNEVHLMLQANPDGRKWAEQNYSWRKNTNNNYCANSSPGRGIDLNRNWPFGWGGPGASSVACDETFRGPGSASEPETQSTVAYVRSIFPDQRPDDRTTPAPATSTGVFLDLHSYGQLVLWSWGDTYDAAPNATQLQTLGRKFAYFNNYTPEQSVGLYPTSGTTDDTVYGELGVAAYTFEMGTNFFQACTTFENTILPANLPALVHAAKAARRPYQSPAGPDAVNVTVTPTTTTGLTVTLTATANDARFNNSNGTEPTQVIAAARYSVDAPSWIIGTATYPMTATDGAFNTSLEAVTAVVDVSSLSEGQHTLFVEAQDAIGNWGVPTAVFVQVGPLAGQGGLPLLTPAQQTGAGQPGEQIAYAIGVKNDGGYTDTFTLTLMGNEWPTTLGVTQTLLAANEWLTVPLTVSIPLAVQVGDMDFVTITAIGLQGSHSAVVRTNSVIEYAVYLPVTLGGEPAP